MGRNKSKNTCSMTKMFIFSEKQKKKNATQQSRLLGPVRGGGPLSGGVPIKIRTYMLNHQPNIIYTDSYTLLHI